MKNTLEKEIVTLRRQNNEKQDNIRRMEENEIVLSSKLAIFNQMKNNFDRDIEFMVGKEKELERIN